METTPDTLNYLIMGYAVFTVVMVSYLVSLYMRWRKLESELHVLDETARK